MPSCFWLIGSTLHTPRERNDLVRRWRVFSALTSDGQVLCTSTSQCREAQIQVTSTKHYEYMIHLCVSAAPAPSLLPSTPTLFPLCHIRSTGLDLFGQPFSVSVSLFPSFLNSRLLFFSLFFSTLLCMLDSMINSRGKPDYTDSTL